jgi:uncharacterized membrane protein
VTSRMTHWFGHHLEHTALVVTVAAAVALAAIVLSTNCALYRAEANSSGPYLLSCIVQALATVLALLVTFSLIATQLASASYSPRAVRQRLTDFWLWLAVFIYGATIACCLVLLSGWGTFLPLWKVRGVNLALVLTGAALVYLVPFTLATLRSLSSGTTTSGIRRGVGIALGG